MFVKNQNVYTIKGFDGDVGSLSSDVKTELENIAKQYGDVFICGVCMFHYTYTTGYGLMLDTTLPYTSTNYGEVPEVFTLKRTRLFYGGGEQDVTIEPSDILQRIKDYVEYWDDEFPTIIVLIDKFENKINGYNRTDVTAYNVCWADYDEYGHFYVRLIPFNGSNIVALYGKNTYENVLITNTKLYNDHDTGELIFDVSTGTVPLLIKTT